MSTQTMKHKLPKELRHIELGKTLVNKDLYFEAFDHFKKSIETNPEYAIDILTYLYKQQLHKKTHINIQLINAKIYIEMKLHTEAFDVFEENKLLSFCLIFNFLWIILLKGSFLSTFAFDIFFCVYRKITRDKARNLNQWVLSF